MSWLIDILVLGFISYGLYRGWRDGVLAATTSLLSLIISLWVAFTFYSTVAGLITKLWLFPQGITNVGAFLLIAVVGDALVSLPVLLIAHRYKFSWRDTVWWRWAGLLPGLIRSTLMAAYLLSLVFITPINHPIKTVIMQSHIAPWLVSQVSFLNPPITQLVQPAVNDLSQLLTVEPNSDELIGLPFHVQHPQLCADAETAMLALVNQERAKVGVSALTMDEPLRQVGRAHALDMYQRGYFSHYTPEGQDPFDRMDKAGIQYQAAGENLALAPNLQTAHTGLMNSPGHKRNILDSKFHKVGIGCYQTDNYGMMFAQEFSN